MFDQLSIFVVMFFVAYVVLYYSRHDFILYTAADGSKKIDQRKIVLSSILIALVAILINNLLGDKISMSGSRRPLLSRSRSKFGMYF